MDSPLPVGYLPLATRLEAWVAGVTDEGRAEYVAALETFLERARKMRRDGALLLLSTAVAGAARLDGATTAGPLAVVNVLTTGALCAALPVVYGVALRRWVAGLIAHDLASASFRLLLRVSHRNAVDHELHGPLLPPYSLASGDLIRWGVGNDTDCWQKVTRKAEVLASVCALVLLALGGTGLCIAAALRAPEPWGWAGSALGVLLAFTAARPFVAAGGVTAGERARV